MFQHPLLDAWFAQAETGELTAFEQELVTNLQQVIVTEHGRTFASVWEEGRHAFTDVLTQYGLAHHRIPAYSPEANGK